MTISRLTRRAAVVLAALLLAACSASAGVTSPQGGDGTPLSSSASPANSAPSPGGTRPSSPATVAIVEPKSGAAIDGTSVHVVLELTGAEIVSTTSTDIRPDRGHVHLYVDNVLVSMNYGLEQDLAVHPGTYVLKAEFVASDHAPFNPRVWSPEVVFTVK